MDLKLESSARIVEKQTETYVDFRTAVPKPSDEDAHLRHILRFYIARSLLKREEGDVFVLPTVNVKGRDLRLDVASGQPGKYSLAICEPGSITYRAGHVSEMFSRREVERCEDASVHRNQMRRELNRHCRPGSERKFLFDLREMAVFRHAVGSYALVALGEEIIQLGLAPRAAHAGLRVRDEVAEVDGLRLDERQDWPSWTEVV